MEDKKYKRLFVLLGLGVLIIIYKVFNPLESKYFPKCPFLELTGYRCPGCGSQRAIHHLLNFDILGAAKENVLLVISIPYLIVGFTFDSLKNPGKTVLKWRKRLFGLKAIRIILVLIISFWILRNMPYFQQYL